MQELVQYIADWVVEDPDAVHVDERERGPRQVRDRIERGDERIGQLAFPCPHRVRQVALCAQQRGAELRGRLADGPVDGGPQDELAALDGDVIVVALDD